MSEICVSSSEELTDDYFEYVTVFLISLNIFGILGMSVLIILETRTKMQYHKIKNRPAKLVLTREYLEKLRPPQKAQHVNTIPSVDSKRVQEKKLFNKKDKFPQASSSYEFKYNLHCANNFH